MESLFRITLFLAGVVNFIPSLIVFLPSKISDSYGVILPDANFELLLRHRAILFGIVGGLMIYAALSKKQYLMATTFGLISMSSFIMLSFIIDGNLNDELQKVVIIDGVVIGILLIGYILFKFNKK